MQKLAHGERLATFGVILGLLAVIAVGAGVILFVFDTRQTARDAVDAQRALKAVIIERCLLRQAYDQRFVDSVKGDVETYQQLLDSSESTELPADTPQSVRDSVARQREILREAIEAKKLIVEEGVVGNCDQYRRIGVPSRQTEVEEST